MKNSEAEQAKRFSNQLNYLHSFIAIPIGQGYKPSPAQNREYDRKLLDKQQLELQSPKKTPNRIISILLNRVSKAFSQRTKLRVKCSEH